MSIALADDARSNYGPILGYYIASPFLLSTLFPLGPQGHLRHIEVHRDFDEIPANFTG